MAVDVLPDLIDKQDAFEIVRDQIAAILFAESISQQALAVTAGKPEPLLWKLRVFVEAQNTIDAFINAPEAALQDPSPIVHVWYQGGTFDPGEGDSSNRQAQRGTFNIDVYGFAIASEDGTGQKPGDREAVFTAQRGVRLIRNILMSAQNTYLQLRSNVWDRWISSLEAFQVELEKVSAHQVVALRISLQATFNEFSPQFDGVPLNFVAVSVHRNSDGMLIAGADFDYS